MIVRVLFLLFPLTLFASEQGCPGLPQVTVEAADSQGRSSACQAARDAIRFLSSHGLRIKNPILIQLVDSPSQHHMQPVFGQFHAGKGVIEVMSLQASRKVAEQSLFFGLEVDAALHRSFIAHEVAHAVANQNFRISQPSAVAHEYIAYTVQLATMDVSLRNRILDDFDLEGFEHVSEINDIYLGLNPQYFAIKAYRHFLNEPDGGAFYRRILAGFLTPGWGRYPDAYAR